MTRWVRSGSSQKHKKMPGDATKWGEFDNQYARKIPLKRKKNIESETNLKQKIQTPTSDFPSSKAEKSLNEDFFDEDGPCLTENTIQMNEQENGNVDESHFNVIVLSTNNEDDSNGFLINKAQNPKMKKKKKRKNIDAECPSLNEKTDKADTSGSEVPKRFKHSKLENDFSITNSNEMPEQGIDHNDLVENRISPEETYFKPQSKKKKKKDYKKMNSDSLSVNCETMETSFNNLDESVNLEKAVGSSDQGSEQPDKFFQEIGQSSDKQKVKKCDKMNSDSNQTSLNNNNCKNSSSKVFENKKEKYLKKLRKKREKLGLLLLPRNVETKLQKIHKKLKEKGFPPEKQKEIMREVRRKEELKYRKVFNPSKLCFGCREAGHVLADCPKKSESFKQETGICFKCGSVEHTSYKCPEKVQGYPYAKCFICKEQGHISRECPKNKHGVYPKGGRCKLCGNVNHLKKDCPTLKKRENEEEAITLHTLSENASIDAEVVKIEEIRKKSSKKAKIVKF